MQPRREGSRYGLCQEGWVPGKGRRESVAEAATPLGRRRSSLQGLGGQQTPAQGWAEACTRRSRPPSGTGHQASGSVQRRFELHSLQDQSRAVHPASTAAHQKLYLFYTKRTWTIAHPAILPKFKAPGVKWRLLINKRRTPCNTLHSIVCRAIDALFEWDAQTLLVRCTLH